MRSDDYATSVPGPVLDIQTGIVLGEKRIACIAENAFHEIKVGYATAGSKKPHLKRLFPDETLHARADDGTKQKGNPTFRRIFFFRGKREDHVLLRGIQGNPEQFLGCGQWDDLFIVGSGQPGVGSGNTPEVVLRSREGL